MEGRSRLDGRARENGQIASSFLSQRFGCEFIFLERSFFHLDMKERTKESVKSVEKMRWRILPREIFTRSAKQNEYTDEE